LFAFLLLFAIDQFAHDGNPYMGLLAYVVSPAFMFLGIGISLLGAWLHRRQLQRTGQAAKPAITIDLTRPRDRRVLVAVGLSTAIFLMLTSIGSYQTYRYTESTLFCGQACHTPMKPEFVAYQHSPHARVDCVECHVGHGAGAYVEAKLNGVSQLIGVITGNYDRPIKTPIPNLRPAQETCEQCHWPSRWVGRVDELYQHFLADETNTPFSVRLSLNVGGGHPDYGESGGIHWHMNLANKVEYIATDEQRQVIPWVRLTDQSGKVTEFRSPDFTNDIAGLELRTMDCLDCHNRPAHNFKPPNEAVDVALSTGRIDATIPWIKSNIVAALVAPYPTEEAAVQQIAQFLQAKYPDEPRIGPTIAAAQQIFKQNFFPEMKADWRAYPNNIGHKEWPGCFRCHDGLHKSTGPEPRTLGASDCNSCHTILAQGSGEQLQQLSAEGHAFFHIDSTYEDFDCHSCHTGAFPN
jgi:nitrate/TMAO reductase-like tetraheme cytochrome c subunit